MKTEKIWNRKLLLFLTSQTISLFGSMLVQYAITWYITIETKSGVMTTISIICGFLPSFFISPFAGVWADRYNRKHIIMLSDSMIALSTLVIAILYITGHGALWLLFAVSAIRALGGGIQIPAVGAFLPELTSEDKLTQVNAANGSIQSLVALAAPMLSGALLTMAAIEVIFFIDVVTAAAAVFVLYFFLQVKPHAKAAMARTASYFGDLKEGIGYILRHDFVKTLFGFCAGFFFLATPCAFLTPLQVARTFGDDVWRLTAIEIAFSGGMVLGGIGMALWGGFKNRAYTMILSAVAIALCTFGLGVVGNFWVYLAVTALVGLAMPVFNTPFTVLLQEKVENDYLGRVFGVLGMISSSMMPLGMLVFGPTADMVKIEWLLMGTGLVLLAQSLYMLGNRTLVEAGRPGNDLTT